MKQRAMTVSHYVIMLLLHLGNVTNVTQVDLVVSMLESCRWSYQNPVKPELFYCLQFEMCLK